MNTRDSKVPRNTAGLLNIIIVLDMLLICSRAMHYSNGKVSSVSNCSKKPGTILMWV